MSRNFAPSVQKHDILSASQDLNQKQTVLHDSLGSARFSVAIRYQTGHTGDRMTFQVLQRIPGRNSDSNADDYYDDEELSRTTIGGSTSGATVKSASAAPHQHIVTVGGFYNNPTSIVVAYEWDVAGAGTINANSKVLALTTWTTPTTGA